MEVNSQRMEREREMADYRIVTETGVEDRIADATSGLLSKTAADGIYVPLSGQGDGLTAATVAGVLIHGSYL